MSELVERGYDVIAERYLAWSLECDWPGRRRYLDHLLGALPEGSDVLELGCGAGVPATAALTERFCVTAVDVSGRQLELARRNAPGATFLKADMAELEVTPASFDAVCAFYSLTHVPRTLHAELFARIHDWLRPGGLFVASLGWTDNPGQVEDDWLGTPMFMSHFDAETSLELVRSAGFEIERQELLPQVEHGREGFFQWLAARRA